MRSFLIRFSIKSANPVKVTRRVIKLIDFQLQIIDQLLLFVATGKNS